jgi:stress-induced morphogen
MSLTIEHLQSCFTTLTPTHVSIKDVSDGCGSSFEMVLVSTQFDKLPTLKRHRLVHECIKEELKIIHALTLKTWTVDEFANQDK